MRAALALALALLPQVAAAQASDPAPPTPQIAPQSPLLTVDPERLWRGSAWGKRVTAETERAATALTEENRKIAADLEAEEKALTAARATLSPEEFRQKADAFDTKVVGIRDAQDGKSADIDALQTEGRDAFFRAVLPLMSELMATRGAVAVIDTRAVFIGAEAIDMTEALIALCDARLGSGSD